MRFVSKTKECFAYNTKIIETPTTKEVYIYENPIFIHSKEKADLTDISNRKKFDEMSAHKQYDSLKRKQMPPIRISLEMPQNMMLTATLITEQNL